MDLKELQSDWDRLASDDALWAVLSDDQKRGGKWNVEEFFATGQAEIDGALSKMEHLGLPVHKGKALDFGCGVGRLSRALAAHFEQVVGIDIAPTMIQLANRFNQHGAKCSFVLNAQADLGLLQSQEFDFVYTSIVLQHMPPRYSARYIAEFLRVLKPSGRLVFQIPSHPRQPESLWKALPKYVAVRVLPKSIQRHLRKDFDQPRMGLYGTSVAKALKIVESRGGIVDVVERNASTGPNWCSYTYYVSKR